MKYFLSLLFSCALYLNALIGQTPTIDKSFTILANDIHNLHTVRMVIKRGKVITNEDRIALLKDAKAFFDRISYE